MLDAGDGDDVGGGEPLVRGAEAAAKGVPAQGRVDSPDASCLVAFPGCAVDDETMERVLLARIPGRTP